MGRTAVDAGVAVDAFALVDDREGLSHRDGALLAGSDAFLASDTADVTVLSGPGTRPFILAAYGNCCRYGHELEKMLRADFHALAAAVAQAAVDGDDAVF